MTGDFSLTSRTSAVRGRLLLVALTASVASCLALMAGPLSTAKAHHEGAYSFCYGWIGGGGECHSPHAYATHHWSAVLFTNERAGCIRWIGYYGEPHSAWSCTPAGSSQQIWHGDPNNLTRVAIKNNNGSVGGNFGGLAHTY